MSKKRLPLNTPERGDRCKLRGREGYFGILTKYDPETNWATVSWDVTSPGPKNCHRFELERIDE